MTTTRHARFSPAPMRRRTIDALLAEQGLTLHAALGWAMRWADEPRKIIVHARLAGESVRAAGALVGLSGPQAQRVMEDFLTLAGGAQRGDPGALRAFTPVDAPRAAAVDLARLDALLREWRTLDRARVSYLNAGQCSVTLAGRSFGVHQQRPDGQATLLGAVLAAVDERGWTLDMHVTTEVTTELSAEVTAAVTFGAHRVQVTAASRLEAALGAYLLAVKSHARQVITAT